MGGRRSQSSGDGGRREQAPKKAHGFARGHGAHHRHQAGKGAPHRMGSGKDRTGGDARVKEFGRLQDDALADLTNLERTSEVERRLQNLEDAGGFGAAMEGSLARGLVVEVVRGNFLTRMLPLPADAAPQATALTWKPGDILRTFTRGTLQQFDTGLSSLVAAGDEIELIVPPSEGEHALVQHALHGILTRVLPRRSEFRRMHPSGRSIQTLAANVDQVIIVTSTAQPDFRAGFVDRVFVCAAACNLPVALVLNKIDLGIPEEVVELANVYRGLGIPVLEVSASCPELGAAALDTLRATLAGRRTIFTGHSGVGKSSLLLALDPALTEDQIRIGEVSAQSGKGLHTTTHARLLTARLASGALAEVIDTPGVREFTPADTDRRNLWGWFPELVRLQGQCAFADCTHTVEQNCAVLAAVERGEIHPRRHQSYVRIYQTLPQ